MWGYNKLPGERGLGWIHDSGGRGTHGAPALHSIPGQRGLGWIEAALEQNRAGEARRLGLDPKIGAPAIHGAGAGGYGAPALYAPAPHGADAFGAPALHGAGAGGYGAPAPYRIGQRGEGWMEAAEKQKLEGEARRAQIAAKQGLDPKTGRPLSNTDAPADDALVAPVAPGGGAVGLAGEGEAVGLAGEGDGYGSDFSL